jgi:protocatechuate 4,5-dioxygenase beta chain
MAQLIGGLATSHIPAIGGAIHKGKQQDPTGNPSSTAFRPSAAGWSRSGPTWW